MKMSETEKIMEILKAGYPNTFAFMTREELKRVALLYYELFRQYDIKAIQQALRSYLLETERNPTPAGLKRHLDELLRNRRMLQETEPQILDHEPDYLSEEERQLKIEELKQKLRDMR